MVPNLHMDGVTILRRLTLPVNSANWDEVVSLGDKAFKLEIIPTTLWNDLCSSKDMPMRAIGTVH